MAARLKITLLFTIIMFLLLSLLCGFIYYFSYSTRLKNIKTHLTNRALTTANMLHQPDLFNKQLMNKIDSTILRSIKNKSIQVYNVSNERIYVYSDNLNDTVIIKNDILDEARTNGVAFFTIGRKEILAYHDNNNNAGIVIITAAFDEEGKSNLQRLKLFCG